MSKASGTVTGFLHTQGTSFVNGNGERIHLRGTALGNWMLLEGYMWGFMGKRADRPRAIEALVSQLCGPKYAQGFFPRHLDCYVTEGDFAKMAEEGLNSVRIPLHWRWLMEEGPGVTFREDGFRQIDRCLALCERYGLYAILDLHGAPGGQTGANIDDSVDDIPRLFLDRDNWNKCIALWREIARRYKDRWIVGGYDLLNEPIRPPREEAPQVNVDYLIPALSQFYTECIAAIRQEDTQHMISLEGAHWARDLRIFDHVYDQNMCLHFHFYWTLPHKAYMEPYLEAAQRLQVPLWLGETGENTCEWYTTLFPLLDELDISWNFWPWKKSIRKNSPSTVRWPENWQQVLDYLAGGPHPGFEAAQKIFDEWLENSRFENTEYVPEVLDSALRKGNVSIPGISYDENSHSTLGGMERSFRNGDGMSHAYRVGAVPDVDTTRRHGDGNVRLDHPWAIYDLQLRPGEFASYAYHAAGAAVRVTLLLYAATTAEIVLESGQEQHSFWITPEGGDYRQAEALLPAPESDAPFIQVRCLSGVVQLKEILIQPAAIPVIP